MSTLSKLTLGLALGVGTLHAGAAINRPDLMYFKFTEGTGAVSISNEASNPVGSVASAVTGLTLGGSGAFASSALLGSSASARYVNTGWSPTLSSGNWTMAFWMGPAVDTLPTDASYFFGDSGAFRGFTEGVAGPNGFLVRGSGITDTQFNGLSTSSNNHIALVYDQSSATISGYLNGVLAVTTPQPNAFTFGTDFSIGGRGPSRPDSAMQAGVWLDEFQLYSRALDASGIVDAMNANFLTTSPVPEPGALTLFGLGLAGLLAAKTRRRSSAAAQ